MDLLMKGFVMKTVFLVSIVFVFLLTGCQSAYYSAMEKVGVHKRDILVDRVEEARDAQKDAQEEFKSALEQLISLTNFDGGELEAAYEKAKNAYENSEDAASTVASRISKIESVAEALFDEWQDEIEEYTSSKLRNASSRRLRETRRQYDKLIRSMRRAEDKMGPVLATLKDNMLYLKHNLNANAIGSLKNEFGNLKQDINRLITEMDNAIAESDAFIRQIEHK